MVVPIIMPRQGQSVESCVITKWYKAKGDTVKDGDLLFSYETDKASFEEESSVNGTLIDIYYSEGEEVAVLSNVCTISVEGESGAQLPELKASDDIIKISPRAENLAQKLGVNTDTAIGSGPYGRIIEKDIDKAYQGEEIFTHAAKDVGLQSPGLKLQGSGIGGRITTRDIDTAKTDKDVIESLENIKTDKEIIDSYITEFTESKLTNMRKVIAGAMQLSLTSIPQLTLNSSFDATDVLNLRKKLKDSKDKNTNQSVTINDMILFAVSRTILRHKELNAHLSGDVLRVYRNVHIGIAVDTERGLMVPTVFNADLLTLSEISKKAKELARMCVDGKIAPELLKGASFTVTNLGTLGVESFTPVINPPQTGILGIGSMQWKMGEQNGARKLYPAIGLSLTFDHRALDGAPAARFLKDLKDNLENFTMLLVN